MFLIGLNELCKFCEFMDNDSYGLTCQLMDPEIDQDQCHSFEHYRECEKDGTKEDKNSND